MRSSECGMRNIPDSELTIPNSKGGEYRMGIVLKVENLRTQFRTERGLVKAVDGVSYDIREGEIVGLVGESGCGKSVSQLSLLQLIPSPPVEIVGGKVIFEGRDLLQLEANGPQMRSIRGGKIAMI